MEYAMGNCYIGKRVEIGKNLLIGNNVTIYGNCQVSDNCIIGDNVTIGFPSREELLFSRFKSRGKSPDDIDCLSKNHTRIAEGVKILPNSVVYSGVTIGKDSEIFEHTRIGSGTTIGEKCKTRYGAQIYTNVIIGNRSIISGFACSRSRIGSNCTMMGNMVHRYDKGWIDGLKEESPVMEDHVIVGFNALLIGNIKISKYVYIAAGAIVTKNIPSKSIVTGNCQICPAHSWKGKLDLNSIFELEDDEDE
jgi:acetyltransferase-like isoleucine patch superfamily enzyme